MGPEAPEAMSVPRTQIPSVREQTGDRRIDAIQSHVKQVASAVNQRGAAPNVLGPYTFAIGGTVTINHGLMRMPSEWQCVDVTGGYGLFQRTAWDDRTITIQSSNACTAWFRIS